MTRAVIDTGFVQISVDPGPDTMRITVQNKATDGQLTFALTQGECEMLADLLIGFAKRKEERKI